MLLLFAVLFTSFTILGCDRNTTKTADNQRNDNAAAAAVNTANNNSAENDLSSDNNKAPNFTLVDTNGKKIKLSDYRGKVVILDFWATWCPPCRKGIPDLIEIQKEFKNKVAIIGVSLDTDTKGDVVPFIKNFGINYPVVLGNQDIVQAYGNIEAIPTSFVIDKKGNIVNHHVGLTPKETYLSEIKKLLGKS